MMCRSGLADPSSASVITVADGEYVPAAPLRRLPPCDVAVFVAFKVRVMPMGTDDAALGSDRTLWYVLGWCRLGAESALWASRAKAALGCNGDGGDDSGPSYVGR